MQIFPRELNLLPLVLATLGAVAGGVLTFVFGYYFSPKNLQVGYEPEQPIPYSHQLHAGELGLDCRYCHSQVERSHEAAIPPTQTCMGCHSLVHTDSPKLDALRQSWETGASIPWVRVNKIPDHAFFDHSVHLAKGVGCVSCHGRVDEMEVVRVQEPISMGWCLDCHRDPGKNLRPLDQITNMDWEPDEAWLAKAGQVAAGVNPPTYCSGCHR